ncbi:hypothetical protein HDU82_001793 [Entophlyctis luteolus]|nr:hypothetical protein HDU82_001793 [Entophlyctis luteolus]
MVLNVAVYVRRLPAEGEDPQRYLLDVGSTDDRLDSTLAALHGQPRPRVEADFPDSDVAERPYRLISDKSYPLVLDVHEGGNLQIYGILRFQLPPNPPEKLAIELSIVGQTEVKWVDQFLFTYERPHTFLRTKDALLLESDPVPEPIDPVTRLVSLPFAIFRTPSHFPISFTSPSSTISYKLVVRIRAKDKRFGYEASEISAPIKVVPPWAGAPPPAIPTLQEGDNGVRVVVDVDGGVHGSVQMFGTAAASSDCIATSHRERDADEDSLWLRPRVLHDGLNARPSVLSFVLSHSGVGSTSVADGDRRSHGGDTDSLQAPSRVFGKSRASSFVNNHSDRVPGFPMLARNRSNNLAIHAKNNYGLHNVTSHESMVVPIVLDCHDMDLPLPYTAEDPLAGHSVPVAAEDSHETLLQKSTSFVNQMAGSHGNALTLISPHIPSAISASRPSFSLDGAVQADAQYRTSEANQLSETSDSDLHNGRISSDELGRSPAQDHSYDHSSVDARSFLARILFNPKSFERTRFRNMGRQNPAVTIEDGATPMGRQSSQSVRDKSKSLKLFAKKPPFPFTFDFLLSSTIVGPNTQIPIIITLNDPHYDTESQRIVEIALVAVVLCGEPPKQKSDYVTLSSVSIPVDSNDFKRKVWFQVPSSDKLGNFAVGFKTMLVELTHKIRMPLKDIQVYVRRLAAPGEDPNKFLLRKDRNTQPTGSQQVEPLPLSERPYRLISEKSHPLLIDVHEGGVVQIYGYLCFRNGYDSPERMSIQMTFLGQVENKWVDHPMSVNYRKHTFFKVRSTLLAETDPKPKPLEPNSDVIALPFAVYCNPSPFPVSFKSPSAKITYSLTFRFRGKIMFGYEIFEHGVPIEVVPPWSCAPPPELPVLNPDDNGVRVVVDVDGSVHGSIKMFGQQESTAAAEGAASSADSASSAAAEVDGRETLPPTWLRPRALHDGMRPRPSVLNISNAYALAEPPAFLETDPEASLGTDAVSMTRTKSLAQINAKDAVAAGVPMKRSKSMGSTSKLVLKHTDSRESFFVPIVLEEQNPDLPLPYTSEDPLIGHFPPAAEESSASAGNGSSSNEFLSSNSSALEGGYSFTPRKIMSRIRSATKLSEKSQEAKSLLRRPSIASKNGARESDTSFDRPFTFDFLLSNTIVGPGTQIPITISFTNHAYNPETLDEIEISLVADALCGNSSIWTHDFIPLASVSERVTSSDFQKRVWFTVPSSEKLGCYAVGFKINLLELSHKMVFRLLTKQKTYFGGWKDVDVELGSVSMTMLR